MNIPSFSGFSTADKTWLPVAEGYETLNVEVQTAADRSHIKVYKALAALRREKIFRFGRFESLVVNDDVFVFRRYVLSLSIIIFEKGSTIFFNEKLTLFVTAG